MNNKRKKSNLFMLKYLYISCTFGIQWRVHAERQMRGAPKERRKKKEWTRSGLFFQCKCSTHRSNNVCWHESPATVAIKRGESTKKNKQWKKKLQISFLRLTHHSIGHVSHTTTTIVSSLGITWTMTPSTVGMS